jgi:hypothetical protein
MSGRELRTIFGDGGRRTAGSTEIHNTAKKPEALCTEKRGNSANFTQKLM